MVYDMKYSSMFVNTMILPVPGKVSEVYGVKHSYFVELTNAFDGLKPFTRGGRSLPVYTVATYNISVAHSIDDLAIINKEIFTISDETKKAYQERYPDGFDFVAFTLPGTKEDFAKPNDALGIRYKPNDPTKLFFPTLHIHGGEDAPPVEDFHHALFITGAKPPTHWELTKVPVGRFRMEGRYANTDQWVQPEKFFDAPQFQAFITETVHV